LNVANGVSGHEVHRVETGSHFSSL
jgi:hypothetical protein